MGDDTMSIKEIQRRLDTMDDAQIRFVDSFEAIQLVVSRNEIDKGFRDDENKRYFVCGDDGQYQQVDLSKLFEARRVALEHSELSEILESSRNSKGRDEHCPDFKNTEIEMADEVIRLMTHANRYGYRLAEAIVAKSRYNASRPMKHGKAF